MEAAGSPALVPAPAGVVAALAPAPVVRLPEAVYRRRRVAVAAIVAAFLTLVLAVGRPDRVPPGEANPWPSAGEAALPAELPGVYVVQPGDTLWDIALAIAPGADPRAWVHELAEAAGGAALEPGQRIVIDAAAVSTAADGADRASDADRRPGQQVAVESIDLGAERIGVKREATSRGVERGRGPSGP